MRGQVVNSKIVRDAIAGAEGSTLGDLVRALHACNRRLWDLEAAVRDRALTDAEVVRLKRAIDSENLARHAAVGALDRHLDACFGPQRAPGDPDAVVDSQSLGQMVDRLSVLHLKLAWHEGAPMEAGLAAQRDRVACCFDRVATAMGRGDGTPQAFEEAKTYGA